MKNLGQMQQPFVYIFVLIVLVLIIIFGFSRIDDLLEVSEEAKYAKFQSDLKTEVSNTFNKNEGTLLTFSKNSKNSPLAIPKDISEICFKDLIIKTKIDFPRSQWQDFSIENLKPVQDELCIIPINNQFSFKLENKYIEGKTIVVISDV